MAKLFVNKKVLNKAKAIVAEGQKPEPTKDQPLPVVLLSYPQHGKGALTTRFVRVLEMDTNFVRGFEINTEFDAEPGTYKTFRRNLISGFVELLHLEPPTE